MPLVVIVVLLVLVMLLLVVFAVLVIRASAVPTALLMFGHFPSAP